MEYFLQQLINGITLGSIYGLIAIGYTMVYGIIGMINFAHGDIFMVGAFVALIAIVGLGLTAMSGVFVLILALMLVLIIAMLVASVYGWTVERVQELTKIDPWFLRQFAEISGASRKEPRSGR